MHALLASAFVAASLATNPSAPPMVPADAPPVEAQQAGEDLGPDRPTTFALSFSPITTFMLGGVLEGEFRLAPQLTAYLAGEFYGAWMGWGVQTGLRWYPKQAFDGFFMDFHGRASDLWVVHHLGGGLELGSQHRLGRSRWAFLWSVGADVGAGRWGAGRAPTDVSSWLNSGLVVVPKLRLMLGYQF